MIDGKKWRLQCIQSRNGIELVHSYAVGRKVLGVSRKYFQESSRTF